MTKFKLEKDGVVLIIIDLQERLMKAMKDKDKVFKNTNLLIACANELNIPIILTEQYPKGLGETVPEIKENLLEYKYIEKNTFTACDETLIKMLEEIGDHKQILVTGSETHVCVFQTVRDLILQDYNVHLVKDAVCSRFDENYENGIELMRDAGAVISNTESVLFDLLKKSGTPEFKKISALLK